MFVIRRCLFPYALIIERFLIFKEQIKRNLNNLIYISLTVRSSLFVNSASLTATTEVDREMRHLAHAPESSPNKLLCPVLLDHLRGCGYT